MSLLDTDVQIFVLTLMLIFGFFLGHAMDGVLGDESFGSYGNMFWIITGFVGVSTKTIFVFGLNAFSRFATSDVSARSNSMP